MVPRRERLRVLVSCGERKIESMHEQKDDVDDDDDEEVGEDDKVDGDLEVDEEGEMVGVGHGGLGEIQEKDEKVRHNERVKTFDMRGGGRPS